MLARLDRPTLRVVLHGVLTASKGRHIQHVTVLITDRTNPQRHAVHHQRAVPPADFLRWNRLEELPDGEASDPCIRFQPDTRDNLVCLEESEPLLPDELTVGEQAGDPGRWQHGQYPLQQRIPGGSVTVAPMGQQGPHQRHGLPSNHHRDQQNIDIDLTQPPVCAVYDQPDRPFGWYE